MNVNCPHCCNGGIENRPDLAHQVVSCPHCGNAMQMPGFKAPMATAYESAPAAPSFRATSRRTSHRRTSWFGNAFGTTSGVLVALAVFFVGVPILACGGCMFLGGMAGVAGSAVPRPKARPRPAREAPNRFEEKQFGEP